LQERKLSQLLPSKKLAIEVVLYLDASLSPIFDGISKPLRRQSPSSLWVDDERHLKLSVSQEPGWDGAECDN
jgi:hypothetical protein